jgi:hypothetical protein
VVPSKKVTVPAATPEPGETGTTVAVKVMASPNTAEVKEVDNDTDVEAGLTA